VDGAADRYPPAPIRRAFPAPTPSACGPVVMKFRTFILVACMVVVPLAALVSHRLPAAVRGWPQRLLASLTPRPAAVGGREPPLVVLPPIDVADTPVAVAAPAAAGLERTSLERLVAHGAVAIECRPLPGGVGQVASCRVPVDADGQLQRVFQARGSDAGAALAALDAQVAAWRRIAAADPPPPLR
jgi:hypothetical protein